jgi:hypothetical protein
MITNLGSNTAGLLDQGMLMERIMGKTELIEILRIRRGQWNSLLDSVGEARMTQPGAEGHWSVKDVICHITAYEGWLVEWLTAALMNSFPGQSTLDDADIERRNARVYELTRAMSLQDVLSDAHQIFINLLKVIKALPDPYFDDPQSAEWFMKPYWSKMKTVSEAVINLTIDHYEEHIPAIQIWIEKEMMRDN